MLKIIGLTGFVVASATCAAYAADQPGKAFVVAQATGGTPESMQIEQQTTQQYDSSAQSNGTSGASTTTTTESPLNTTQPTIERNRIDSSGAPRERLQIDDGVAATVRGTSSDSQNNTIVRGAPSTSGTATTSSPASGSTGTSSTGASSGSSGSSAGGGSSGSGGGGGSH